LAAPSRACRADVYFDLSYDCLGMV
jgi:hypothetical protein